MREQFSVDAGKGGKVATVTVVLAPASPATFRACSGQHTIQWSSVTLRFAECSGCKASVLDYVPIAETP